MSVLLQIVCALLCVVPSIIVNDLSVKVNSASVAFFELFFVAFVLFSMFRSRQYTLNYYYVAYFLFFVSVLTLSTLYVGNGLYPDRIMEYSWARASHVVIHIVFGFCLYSYMVRNQFDSSLFWILIIVPSLYLMARLVLAWIVDGCGIQPCKHWLVKPPLHANIRHVSEQFAFFSVISTTLFFSCFKHIWLKVFCLIISVLCLATLFWTGGRGAILAVLVSFLLLFVSLNYSRVNLRRDIVVWCFCGISVSVLLQQAANLPWLGVGPEIDKVVSGVSLNELSVNRFEMWSAALDYFVLHWSFGYGANAYFLIPELTHGIHAHNVIIESLLEVGIIGTTWLFVGFTIWLFRVATVMQRYRSSLATVLVPLLGMVCLLVNGLTGAVFMNGITLFYFACCIAVTQSSLDRFLKENNG